MARELLPTAQNPLFVERQDIRSTTSSPHLPPETRRPTATLEIGPGFSTINCRLSFVR